MQNAAVVPDGDIIRVLPAMTNLKVVVVCDQVDKTSQHLVAFLLSEAVDTLYVVTNTEDALPTSDWVGANDWVYSLQLSTDVLGSATRLAVQLKVVLLSRFCKARLCIGGSEAFKELLVRWRKTIVKLVAACPECVYPQLATDRALWPYRGLVLTTTSLWQFCQSQ